MNRPRMPWRLLIGLILFASIAGLAPFQFSHVIAKARSLEAAAFLEMYKPALKEALVRSPRATTAVERTLLERLIKDKSVVAVVYVDRNGLLRWHRDERLIGQPFQDHMEDHPELTEVLEEAKAQKEISFRETGIIGFSTLIPQRGAYVGYPLVLEGDLLGVLALHVTNQIGHLSDVEKERAVAALAAVQALPAAPSASAASAGDSIPAPGAHFTAETELETRHLRDPSALIMGPSESVLPGGQEPRYGSSSPSPPAQQAYLEGMIHYQKGDYAKARARWKEALRRHPGFAEAEAGLAKLSVAGGSK